MITRLELLTSKEYWRIQVANGLWNAQNKRKYNQCYNKACKIVDDNFIAGINEVKLIALDKNQNR